MPVIEALTIPKHRITLYVSYQVQVWCIGLAFATIERNKCVSNQCIKNGCSPYFLLQQSSLCSYSFCGTVMLRETWCIISCSLLPVSFQNKWVSFMYEREWKEMSLTNVFLPHRETFSGIFIQGICISSWPLKVHPRAVLFSMFIKMYIKCGCYGGHFSQNHEGC